MINFSYNLSIPLKNYFLEIEDLRKQILLQVFSPKTEKQISWESKIKTIFNIFLLADRKIEKKEIEKILISGSLKNSWKNKEIINLKEVLDNISFDWLVNKRQITFSTVLSIYEKLGQKKERGGEQRLGAVLNYLENSQEHPVIKAGISYIQLLTIKPFKEKNYEMASILMKLFFYKYGYNFRGWLVLEEEWNNKRGEYLEIINNLKKEQNITLWLEFFAKSIIVQIKKIIKEITTQKYGLEMPLRLWELSERQKEILALMDNPELKITNRKIQKKYQISQITASRDLGRLANLGYIFSHGKGRAVYYTKV